jgi:hypothetical protein
MAKIIIKPQAPAPQSPAGETGHLLQIRVEWVNNQLTNGQWGEKNFLFSKVKVVCEEGELHFDHWVGGFYQEEGAVRISTAHFNLDKPLPEGSYTVRVYRSADAKTWVADGSVKITLGQRPSHRLNDLPTQQIPTSPHEEPSDLRWAAGL